MIRRIVPFVLALLALAAGAFAGDILRARTSAADAKGHTDASAAPAHDDGDAPPPQLGAADAPAAPDAAHGHAPRDAPDAELASFSFPQQFFVPLVRGGDVQAMMILSLSIVMSQDQQEDVSKKENQLRDALLRQLLIHANTGGFDGNFTADAHTALLRGKLLSSAQKVAGDAVVEVLIGDISKQDGQA